MAPSIYTSPKRSYTGHHTLLPAFDSRSAELAVPLVPTRTRLSWTFGRGSVIWRIWPAVLLHTVFAAIVVSISLKTRYDLSIPSVLLTVLGVVIGFVISYRASSGYDRYWMGRSSWSDVIRTSRTMSRLIWFHVPVHLKPRTQEGVESNVPRVDESEMNSVMEEKRMALDLVEGFVVSLKHHLRGEMGIYYEDLYHLIQPQRTRNHQKYTDEDFASPATVRAPLPIVDISQSTSQGLPSATTRSNSMLSEALTTGPSSSFEGTATANLHFPDPEPVTTYGTFTTSGSRAQSDGSHSSHSSNSEGHLLLPSSIPHAQASRYGVSAELIPLESLFAAIVNLFATRKAQSESALVEEGGVKPKLTSTRTRRLTHTKHRPRVAGGGENLPLEILRYLSDWLSVLDERGTVSGNGLGGMFSCIQSFEDSLSTLERILTTPLPFVYSVHIRHTVWIYLFSLPFQLIGQFGWYTIPGVGIAAFIYLGFLAAGEEIEQPFGYDENDLDLDLFCHEVVHADIQAMKRTPCHNSYLSAHHHNRIPTQSTNGSAFGNF